MMLKDNIAYQEGAIVSKEIVKKAGGTVTLFAFDKGEGLSEHKTPFEALIFLLEGEVEVRLSGKTYKLKSGEFLVMPACQPHSLKATERFKMMLAMIKA